MNISSPTFRFRAIMVVFIIGLILSGVTAFPLLYELKLLSQWLGVGMRLLPKGTRG